MCWIEYRADVSLEGEPELLPCLRRLAAPCQSQWPSITSSLQHTNCPRHRQQGDARLSLTESVFHLAGAQVILGEQIWQNVACFYEHFASKSHYCFFLPSIIGTILKSLNLAGLPWHRHTHRLNSLLYGIWSWPSPFPGNIRIFV